MLLSFVWICNQCRFLYSKQSEIGMYKMQNHFTCFCTRNRNKHKIFAAKGKQTKDNIGRNANKTMSEVHSGHDYLYL